MESCIKWHENVIMHADSGESLLDLSANQSAAMNEPYRGDASSTEQSKTARKYSSIPNEKMLLGYVP